MTIGTLHSHAVLDQPSRIHCGTKDIVTGNVVVAYQRSSISDVDLFGPLTVTVTLHGRAKSKIRIKKGSTTYTYRGRVALFSTTVKLFSGPFRAEPGVSQSFPFALKFPSQPQPYYAAEWAVDARFKSQKLPPTMNMHYSGFQHHFDCFNEYRVGADIRMANIDVKIANMDKKEEPHVLYEQPRISPHAVLSTRHPSIPSHYIIQNEFLLPEADRPSGFRAKAKAVFTSDYYPRYQFDFLLSAPRHAYVGERLLFDAELRPLPESSTAVVIPEFTLQDFTVTVKSYTHVRAPRGTLMFSEPDSHGTETCFVMARGPQAPGSFLKSNDYKQVIRTARLVDLPSTFSTTTTMRTYSMKVQFVLAGAGKKFTVKNDYALVLHPPIEAASTGASLPSTAPDALQPYPTEIYAQVEAGPSAEVSGLSVPLPQYEAPPDYEKHNDVALLEPQYDFSGSASIK